MRQERIKWLKASVGRQIRLIDVDEVLFFQSDTKYTRVKLPDSEALVRMPLKDLLGGLDRERFWQIHRGTVVNVGAIAAAERIDAERMQVLLRGCDEKLPVSRTFAHLFRD
jgi:DNA-binding LytR/AlgR family response regulator